MSVRDSVPFTYGNTGGMSGFIYRKELSSIKVSWPNFCSPILTTRSGKVLINHDKTTQKPAKNNNQGETFI